MRRLRCRERAKNNEWRRILSDSASGSSSVTARPAARRRWLFATLAVAIAAVIFALLKFTGLAPFGTTEEGPENSIAVLPLKDVSPEGNAGPFADGIAAELVNALSQTAELRVAGTTSSFSLRNDPRPLPDLGRVLGVRYLVEGTVSRIGERVRVSVRLVEAANGFRKWSETYDRPSLTFCRCRTIWHARSPARSRYCSFGVPAWGSPSDGRSH